MFFICRINAIFEAHSSHNICQLKKLKRLNTDQTNYQDIDNQLQSIVNCNYILFALFLIYFPYFMKFIIHYVQIRLHNIMRESRAFVQFTTLLSLSFLFVILRATNVPPNFITTIPASFQVGTAVLTSSSSTTSGSFASQSTTVTYLNTYSTTPQFGFGFGFINSAWPTTTSTLETVIDITIVTSSTGYQILQLNYTASTINILSINYIACVSGFFVDVRTTLLNTSALTVASSSLNTVRTTTLSIPYKSKSNSSNSIAVYTVIGISMVRAKNTFEYSLTTNGFATSTITVTLTVQPYNGVRFLRFSVFNYESIVVTVDSPFFLDMGFGTTLGGTIPDSSNLGLTTLGTIFTGMTDWAISDTFATIAYNMSLSGRIYSLESSTATRTQTAYVWYRQMVCPTYYFNRTNVCVPCHYSCLTCFEQSSRSCSTCDGTEAFRTFLSSNFSCPCMANYKDTSVYICQAILCPGYCTTCSDDNICTVCNSVQYRKISNGTCVCIDYTIDMWDYGSPTCSACYPTCLTCSQFASQTACLTCSLSKDHRTFVSSTQTCVCVSGYYQILNLNNPASANPYLYKGAPCLACQYSCATCTNNSVCLTCNSSINRLYSSVTKLCYCQSGYYDNFLQQTCLACPYNCLTCTSASVCTSCPSTREIKSNNCTCTMGFFQSGVSQCTACNISCQTCSSANQCTSCSISNFRTMSGTTCICTTGYYDTFVVQPCEPCDATCKTCSSGASNNCQSCESIKFRELTSSKTCVCITGYYQAVDMICSACNYRCLTCENSVQCLTCNATNQRIKSGTTCVCANRYYDDSGNQLCKSCMYFCLTCTSSTTCQTCDSTTRSITDLSRCPCLTGFYDDGVSSSCLACLPSCLTCTNANNCTTCPSNRAITTLGSCVCNSRTFQPYCNSCYYSCLACSGTSTTCTSCNGTALRYLDSSTSRCICYQGYYDDSSNQLCVSCHSSCLTCTSASSCTSCPVNRVANGSYCSCISTFYQNSQNLNCLACHYTCLTCSDYSTCTTCQSANNRVTSTITSLCVCSNGYYDNGVSQICFQCHPICQTCSAYSTCLSCNSAQNFYFSNNTCLCVKGYYFNSATNACISCHYSCDSCSSGTACLTCKNNRTLTATFCTCISGLFDDSSTQTCTLCTYPCITCVTTSSTCTSCDSTRTLSSGACVCPQKTYDTGLSCTACHFSCQICTNGSSCVTCLTGSGRILDSSGICLCPTGYHDENGTSLTCFACNYSCITCINSVSCSSCYTGRSATVGGHCICPTLYYYDNFVNPPCISCSYSCLSCQTLSTKCISCDSSTYRGLINNTCQCSTGYFDNYVTATCQTCHYTCATCSSSNACSTCNSSSKRIYLTGPTCSCMSGFYDISNVQLCATCDFTCLTCISQSNRCITCPATRTLQSASNSCPCNAGLYSNGNPTCVACLTSCLTCDNGATCLSCPSTRQLNSIFSCICKSGYYDVTGISQCSSCSPFCFQCSSFSVCTLCDTANNHRQLVNTSCQCPTGYYDAATSGNYSCQLCPYSCATCVSISQCSSCNINYQRIYSLATKLCICSNGFYDDSSNQACQPCPIDCLTCQSSSICLTCSTDRYLDASNRCSCINSTYLNGTLCQSCPVECLSCSSSAVCTSCVVGRILVNNACVCPSGQYSIVGTSSCSACHYSCTTCVSSAQCSTCNSTMNRYLTSTLCLCAIGYYDGAVQNCISCHYSCLMCLSGTSCQACSISSNRVYNSNTTLCSCVPGYYEDTTTKICIQCHYSCLTCSSGSQCTSCNTNVNRILNNITNQCICNPIGYFDTFISATCSSCDYTCLTCSGSSTFCNSCLNTTFRTLSVSKCNCAQGYYDVANQPICLRCSYKCVTCLGTSDNCTLCSTSNYRQIIPSCSCITGYYDTGNQSLCATCSYHCQTCSNGLTCTTCNLTISYRALNTVTSLCDCIPQYYNIGRAICQKCAYSCQTCTQASSCLTCPTTRSLTQGQCICLQKYYDDYTSLECQSCDYSCQTCMNSSSCFSCSSANKRTFNSSTYLCSCMIGYYDISIETCSKCDVSCYTCLDGVSCSSCPPNINKTLNATTGSNFCVCLYGYYENITAGTVLGYNSVCNPCYFACSTCSGLSTTCTFCTPTSNRYLTTSKQCACNIGYFQIFGQQNCLACFTNCLTCFGVSATSCLSCDNTTYYLNNSCYTSCPSFYNISQSTRTCVSCPSNCLSCPNSLTICTSCNSPYFIFAYNSSYSSCIDKCPSVYYQLNRACFACITPCITCTGPYACLTCISKYYLIGTLCNPCHTLCQTCSGSTVIDCLTCISDYVLRGGICQKINCLATQYVQSSNGCVNCTTTFPNSLSCLSTGPTSCQEGFILSNSTCKNCVAVPGYTYSSVTGKCQDYCGDGIVITDLCDDGNNLNGDGCSSWCTIESGWNCINNVCTLLVTPTLNLISVSNNPKKHVITIIFSLSVGVRLVSRNFILTFSQITQYSYQVYAMNIHYNMYRLQIAYKQTAANNNLNIQIKSPISRLLSTSTQLSISLSLNIDVAIITNPPAIYISEQQSKVFTTYLFGLIGALQVLLLVVIVVFLAMKLKIMLLVIDAINSIRIVYILTGLGLYNITLLSHQSSRGLQPFIYPFGADFLDTTSNFYYFSYTSNFFSSTVIQYFLITTAFLLSFFFSKTNPGDQNIWSYYKTSLIFAFSYDIALASFSIFFWSGYNSYQSSYSSTFAILSLIYLAGQAIIYYSKTKNISAQKKKVVPAVSFITNQLEIKDKANQDINIFEFYEDSGKEKKISKAGTSEISDQNTEIMGGAEVQSSEIEEITKYYDLTPSEQSHYSSKTGHISSSYLPICSILFSILFSAVSNIQEIVIRSAIFLVFSFCYLFFIIFLKKESLKSLRNIKLIVFSLVYVMLSIFSLVLSTNYQNVDLISMDSVIISFVCAIVIFNIIIFIVSVCKSEAFKEYLVNRKNEQILQRIRKQNEARQKIYTKNEFNKTKKETRSKIDIDPSRDEIRYQKQIQQIQVSQEQVQQQKNLKLSNLKKKTSTRDDRTMLQIRDKDSSSIIRQQIDQQISDARYSDFGHHNQSNLLNEKNIFDLKRSAANDEPSGLKKMQGSRVRAINNSELSLGSKKGETPSLFFDQSLERIDEYQGVKRNINKSNQKEEMGQKKKIKRKKRPNADAEVISGDEIEKKEVLEIDRYQPRQTENQKRKESEEIVDMLQQMDMPRGFKMDQNDSNFRARILSIDQISSIKQQRDQFMEQQHSQYDGSVFNKILQDYKKYRHKKVDKKKLKQLKDKKNDRN